MNNKAEIPAHGDVPKLIHEPPEYHRGAMYLEIKEEKARNWIVKVLHKPSGKYLFVWKVYAGRIDLDMSDTLWGIMFRYMGAE